MLPRIEPQSEDAAFAEWVRVGLLQLGSFQWCGCRPYSVKSAWLPSNPGVFPFDLMLTVVDNESGNYFLHAFAEEQFETITAGAIEDKEFVPLEDIYDDPFKAEMQEIYNVMNNPGLIFQLPQDRIDHLTELGYGPGGDERRSASPGSLRGSEDDEGRCAKYH